MSAKNIFQFTFHRGAIPSEKISNLIDAGSAYPDVGAYNVFLGQVRNDTKEQGVVTSIEYTANESLAYEVMQKIMNDAIIKYSAKSTTVIHSLGNVSVGETCLVVFVMCKHRKESFESCEYIVERLKKELPVWGKEILENNSHSWKINT